MILNRQLVLGICIALVNPWLGEVCNAGDKTSKVVPAPFPPRSHLAKQPQYSGPPKTLDDAVERIKNELENSGLSCMVWKKDETTLNVTVSRENPNRALGRMIIKEDGGQITIRSEPHLNSVLGELNLLNRLRHGLQIDIDKVKTDEIVATSRARAPAAPPRILRVDEIAAGMNQIFASVKPSLHARIEEGRIIVHNNSRGDLGYFTLINNGGTATLRTARPTAAVLNTLKVWESLQRFASQHQLTLTWKDTP